MKGGINTNTNTNTNPNHRVSRVTRAGRVKTFNLPPPLQSRPILILAPDALTSHPTPHGHPFSLSLSLSRGVYVCFSLTKLTYILRVCMQL